jgi:hypothetical protein
MKNVPMEEMGQEFNQVFQEHFARGEGPGYEKPREVLVVSGKLPSRFNIRSGSEKKA